ncbi:VPLPA-CTERM sorting domain-containing protein [Methylicorpusculum sp.]|uniref:VPLPA-CTERM sorting domain-containing protein n=1 Tax=Methylicorpusculum sp. TaxID=2713644 RepID=UPI002733BC05|nr:VPLPA-CTERM sorting domain-containing protein [Methylicorpusculum sp.]MDP3529393.1 VPLPA-CTERM sorting domain-containing protein [Methylicorpusculum sp.]
MKKLYQLAALASLTLVAGQASATLVNGNTTGNPSSVVLSVVDRDQSSANFGYTFVVDTGFKYSDFVNGNVTSLQNWDLAALSNFAGFKESSSLQYSVVGAYSIKASGANRNLNKAASNFADPANTQWGVLTLSQSVDDFILDKPSLQQAAGQQGVSTGAIPAYINQIIFKDVVSSASIAPVDGQSFFDQFFTIGSLARSANQVFSIDETAPFWWLSDPNIGTSSTLPRVAEQLGSFTLTSEYQLAYAPVPVPAAVWLFGTALAGLLGLGRRKAGLATAA